MDVVIVLYHFILLVVLFTTSLLGILGMYVKKFQEVRRLQNENSNRRSLDQIRKSNLEKIREEEKRGINYGQPQILTQSMFSFINLLKKLLENAVYIDEIIMVPKIFINTMFYQRLELKDLLRNGVVADSFETSDQCLVLISPKYHQHYNVVFVQHQGDKPRLILSMALNDKQLTSFAKKTAEILAQNQKLAKQAFQALMAKFSDDGSATLGSKKSDSHDQENDNAYYLQSFIAALQWKAHLKLELGPILCPFRQQTTVSYSRFRARELTSMPIKYTWILASGLEITTNSLTCSFHLVAQEAPPFCSIAVEPFNPSTQGVNWFFEAAGTSGGNYNLFLPANCIPVYMPTGKDNHRIFVLQNLTGPKATFVQKMNTRFFVQQQHSTSSDVQRRRPSFMQRTLRRFSSGANITSTPLHDQQTATISDTVTMQLGIPGCNKPVPLRLDELSRQKLLRIDLTSIPPKISVENQTTSASKMI